MRRRRNQKTSCRIGGHKAAPRSKAQLGLEALEHRIVLTAPQFVSLQSNGGEVLTSFDILETSPRELTIRFDQDVDGSPTSLDGIKILRNGEELTNVSRELGLLGNTVVLRFADVLPDDLYSVQITDELQNTAGEQFDPNATANQRLPLNFELDLGTKVAAVVPQPITRTGATLSHALDQVEVYFNDDELSPTLAGDPSYYSLALTRDSVTNTDDSFFTPISANYSAEEAKVTLTFANDLHTLVGGDGTLRLRVGTNAPNPSMDPLVPSSPALDPSDSFDAAFELPPLVGTSQIIQSSISTQAFPLDFPGSAAEPGRNPNLSTSADAEDGIRRFEYNFLSEYEGLTNLITEPQKERVREALEIASSRLGIDVFESDAGGTIIAVNPNTPADPDVLQITFPALNYNNEFLAQNTQGQPSFFATAFSRLFGAASNLNTGDIRFIREDSEAVFPRNDVETDAQHEDRPDGIDVDLYRFNIAGTQSGRFSAEILAERANSTSTLDAMLRLYRETPSGSRELIAQNDDYFSEDSFIELSDLEPGTYFIGVSSTGNDRYNPAVADTGFGGTSEGDYELRLNFRPDVADTLMDTSGVALDGDGDGTPGGTFNFWFRAATPSGSEIRQNEVQEISLGAATGGTIRILFEGDLTAQIPFDASPSDVQSALEALDSLQPGDISVTGPALPSGPLRIEFVGDRALTNVPQLELGLTDLIDGAGAVTTVTEGDRDGRIIYVDKTDTTPDDQPNVGSIDNPYNVIHAALNLDIDGLPKKGILSDPNAATPRDVVRILSNSDSVATEVPYQVGLNSFNNQPLADGAKLDIPNDVTVMVDAGAVFQLRRSAIIVGSTSVGIDHSLAAFQALGTPDRNVVFTSVNDFGAGTPVRGDWGGILFDGSLDQDSFRERYEERGIFLNHLSQADIRFGGGVVNVGSIPQEVAPVDIRDARPTVKFNDITSNAVAAITATPDSFEETNFHSSEFQAIRFTSDYRRIGPDIQDNQLANNTINGLFMRIDTLAGSDLTRQTVSGRWDDIDIVHVLSEVLEIQGTPGGSLNGEARTDARLSIDPNVIVKLEGARIETGVGAQLIAEGRDGQNVTFTSVNDNRFGASGSFDTSSNNTSPAAAGDWGGIYIGHSSTASIDHALIAYAGGVSAVEGAFVGFNAVEIHQADVRIANSTFIQNASGRFGESGTREGRGENEAATIFVRAAQPVILNNNFISAGAAGLDMVDPAGVFSDVTAVISINANSLNRTYLADYGRSTGEVDRLAGALGNQGPLVRNNRLEDNDINGMLIRGETLDSESVWDDTDIVHVLFDPIYIPDIDTFGGLRLESKADESLVVKMGGTAGFHATGTAGATNDRIGGTVHVLGQPGRPVVMTSIADDTVGAGKQLDGSFQNATVRAGLGAPDTRGSLEIGFNFSREVSENPILVAALEEAARFWESKLTDDIELNYDVFIAPLGPETLASAGADGFVAPFDDVIAAMQFDAAPDETDLLNRLPSSTQITVQAEPGAGVTVATDVISVGAPTAKALGFAAGNGPSQTISGATRDGQINVNRLIARTSTLDDFVPTMIHEIGHTLGFSSSVPEDGVYEGNFVFTTWDLFRMAPGGGASDFTNNPRVIDPNLEQVIYDGGFFDPVGIDIAGLSVGDLPVSRGTEFADGTPHPDDGQPSHWRSPGAVGMNGISLGVMGPSGGLVSSNDFRSMGLMGWDVSDFALPDVATPGNWEGISLDRFSNDRNVDTVVEIEGGESDASGANSIPDRAEFVGSLASGEFAGDENLRLGFEIHGILNAADDIDVFSFEGIAGTEIYIDVDNTASSLDAVVDLIDANATRLARSDNSFDGPDDLIGSALVTPSELVDSNSFYSTDHFSVNPKDPGMRLTLPGQAGTRGTYFVRMLSNSAQTEGAYELNIRLRPVDEAPGSTVRYADIRYATNGIAADGLVANSPIQAEFVEPGDTVSYDLALSLGSPYESNRGEISVSGVLEQASTIDVDIEGNGVERQFVEDGIDWYQFSSSFGGFSLDIDFADGVSGTDTRLAVYQVGTTEGVDADADEDDEIIYHLIYFGDGSDVEDDQGALFFESSFGQNDPFVGPLPGFGHAPGVQTLRDGETRDITYGDDFVVAVTSSGVTPVELFDQYNTASYTEQLTSAGIPNFATIDLIPDAVPAEFTLNDLALYVVSDEAGGSQLQTVNPFTGAAQEAARTIRDSDIAYTLGSLGMRPDGSLFSLSLGMDVETSGNLIAIDWAAVDGGEIAENLGDDGIVGYVEIPSMEDPPEPSEFEELGDGIEFAGMHISSLLAFGVGSRGDGANALGAQYTDNIVYGIDIYDGIDGNDTAPGIALPVDPVRETDEEAQFYFGNTAIAGSLTDIIEIGAFTTGGDLINGLVELGGLFYGISDAGNLYELTPGALGEAGATNLLGNVAPVTFTGLELGPANADGGSLSSTLFGITSTGDIHAFDLNAAPQGVFEGGASMISTGVIGAQGLAFSTLDQNLWSVDGGENLLTFTAPTPAPGAEPFFTGNESPQGMFNRDLNFPGGAHGTFDVDVDLTNAVGELPNLYFEYQLRTQLPDGGITPSDNDTPEDPLDDFFADTNRDVFRVYATNVENPVEADWVLMATNNFLDALAGPVSANVQQLFDDTRLFEAEPDNETFFRQARIPLQEFEGTETTLRFEFSTEGTFFPNDADDIRTGHDNGDYGHVPVRTGDITDNQVPAEVAALDGDAFLGAEVRNAFVANSERGESAFHPVLTEPDGTATPPRFVRTGFTSTGNYQLYIRPGIADPMFDDFGVLIPPETAGQFARYEPTTFDTVGIGDTNRFRDQGQLVLHSNRISDSAEYGIRIETSEGVASGAANLITTNSSRFVRGPVIENNVIAGSGIAGILYEGDVLGIGAVQFGRVVNNTIVGDAALAGFTSTVGIELGANVSPTLLNNLIAYTGVGISQQSSSATTVIGGTLFHGNTVNGPTGQFPLFSTPIPGAGGSDGLFRNPFADNFLLVDGALAIDSSVNSQEDRPSIASIYSSLGIDFVSSILAPDRDGIGQLRIDDPFVESPPGLGSNVIKDRGALERADRVGPRGELLSPVDNSTIDLDPTFNSVRTSTGPFDFFEIRLADVDFSGNNLNGVGIDDLTVVGAALRITRDGQLLTQDIDYRFSYNTTSDVIALVPLAGVWTPGLYEIELNNAAVTDLAGNALAVNEVDGTTKFRVEVLDEPGPLGDYGDAPVPFPTRFGDGGAVHLDVSTIFLGADVDTETNGSPSANADSDVDDGVALQGSGLLAGSTATVVVTASADSLLDAWVDFNADGAWEASEQIFSGQTLSAGDNTLTFAVPIANEALTYARFRVSSTGGLMPGGTAADGEVEDYAFNIVDAGSDFGDAPSPYPEASHRILPGFQLGATVDAEEATQETDTGDDGVVFVSSTLVPGASTSVSVTSSAAGTLAAWIDFNNDGDWDDAGEQLFGGATSINGSMELPFTVPEDAAEGTVAARFRFSDGLVALTPSGAADNGEVEDYLVNISTVVATWHNESFPADVDAGGFVSPVDALLVINELNDRVLSDPETGVLVSPATPPPFIDVDNNGVITPVDALIVINSLEPSDPPSGNLTTGGSRAVDGRAFGQTEPTSAAVMAEPERHVDLALRSYKPTESNFGEYVRRADDANGEDHDLLDDVFAGLG